MRHVHYAERQPRNLVLFHEKTDFHTKREDIPIEKQQDQLHQTQTCSMICSAISSLSTIIPLRLYVLDGRRYCRQMICRSSTTLFLLAISMPETISDQLKYRSPWSQN